MNQHICQLKSTQKYNMPQDPHAMKTIYTNDTSIINAKQKQLKNWIGITEYVINY